MEITESLFAVITIIRVDPPRDGVRFVYYDIEGENGGTAQVPCAPDDTSTVFWQRVQTTLTAIAQKYVPGKEINFSGVSFPNPDKVVAFAREKR